MRLSRLELATLFALPEYLRLEDDPRSPIQVSLNDFARFKHGDSAYTSTYAKSLAQMSCTWWRTNKERSRLFVTGPPRRYTPSAAHSLVAPFIEEVSRISASESMIPQSVHPLALVKRETAIPNIYSVPRAQAVAALMINTAIENEDQLKNAAVIFIDDIRVAGLREESTASNFQKLGVAAVLYAYIIRCAPMPDPSVVEQRINSTFVSTLETLIDIATSPNFAPNIRFCKALLSLSASEKRTLLLCLPPNLRKTVLRFIRTDDVESVIRDVP